MSKNVKKRFNYGKLSNVSSGNNTGNASMNENGVRDIHKIIFGYMTL